MCFGRERSPCFGHECVLEERDLHFFGRAKGSLENVLEGLGEPIFDKEVLG